MSINQGQFNIDAVGTVTIGEGHSSGNQITITIKNNSAAQVRTRITIGVKCGNTPEALLNANTVTIIATYAVTGKPQVNLSAIAPASDSRTWQTSSKGDALDAGQTVTIKLSTFESNTPPGKAIVDVQVQTYQNNAWTPALGTIPAENRRLTIEKEAEPKPSPAIHYFTVNPDYILHAGQTPVELGFYATGFDSLVMFRNNQEVQNWPSNEHPKNIDGSIADTFTDHPSITTAYRLEGKSKAEGEKRKVKYRSVQVISPGWNQVSLPQGYPARLFVSADFTPSESKTSSNRLYGIFIDSEGRAALYSSATGVDDWRLEPGDVPQDMAMSPGVAYHDKLWLIGGSCIDPADPGSDVWCYELNTDSEVRRWNKKTVRGPIFPDRMGHACIVSQGKLWVLAGYCSPTAFRDVWQLNDDEKGNLSWQQISEACGWNARVNPAAAAFTNVDNEEEVWIYGGSAKPQSDGLNDLWSTKNGRDWSKLSSTILPDPGIPLGATLVVYPKLGSSPSNVGDRLFLTGSFLEWATGAPPSRGNRVSSFLFEWHGLNLVWEERPVFNGWQQFRGENFYMQAISFNGFLFVWSLQPRINQALKLNILVS